VTALIVSQRGGDEPDKVVVADPPAEKDKPADKAVEDKVEKDKVEKDKVEKDKVEKDKVEKDKVEKDKVEKDKVEKPKPVEDEPPKPVAEEPHDKAPTVAKSDKRESRAAKRREAKKSVEAAARSATDVAAEALSAVPAVPREREIVPKAVGNNPSVVNGPNVTTGPNVGSAAGLAAQPPPPPTPTKFTRPIDYAPKNFHGVAYLPKAYLPKAYALAKSVWPDVGLVSFEINNVFPDGHADLTLPDGEVEYLFRSPSHSARPAGLPSNKSVDIECYIEVTLTATHIAVRTRSHSGDENCRDFLRAFPKCTPAGVWNFAKLQKAKLDTVAKVSFLHDGSWWFDNQDSNQEGVATSYPDQCP
jgi:hypothetical protein